MMQKQPIPPGVTEVKPRLTKEQHDILEAEFQRHHKPSTTTKKGFADHLGVPLDKINNWFQNRRAKVKQEAKKAQNAQMEAQRLQQVQQEQSAQHASQVSQQPMSDFYSLNSSYQAMALPSNESLDTNQTMDDAQRIFAAQQQQQQQSDYNALYLSSISEATQHATKDTVIQSMIKAGYEWDQIGLQDMSAPGFDTSQFGLSLDMANVADALNPSAMPQGFEFAEENGVSGVSPSNSTSSGPSATFSVAPTAASTATNPMASSTNLSFNWPEHPGSSNATPAKQADNPFENGDMANFSSTSLPASSSQVSLGQWMSSASFQPVMYHSSNNSSQAVLSSPEQVDASQLQNFADLEPPMPPFAENAYSRRSSSTSVLADKLTNVGIQQVPSNDSNATNQSNGGFQLPASSLAARRQRHPAPLNQTMRSASFTSGMASMPSPGAPQSLAAEHTLRRIRSTGLTNGRIQKPTSASAQRSPLHFTFEQAANSPKFARQVAGYATAVSTPGLPVSSGSLAPPTPCTPSDGGRFPSAWQPNGIAKPRPPLTDTSSPPDSLGIQWPSEQPPTSDGFPVNSPPRTPLEANQLNQLRQNGSLYRDTPPQSAPATQASFPRPIFAPASIPGQDFLTPSSHIRRPSLPVSTFPVDSSMPFAVQIPTAAGDLQIPYGMQAANPVMGGFPGDALPMYAHDSHMAAAAAAGAQSMPGGADFYVHHYAPPQSTDPKGAASPRRQENQVKNYVFANAGPHDFQSTGAS